MSTKTKISKIKDRVIARLKDRDIKVMGSNMAYIPVPLAIMENMLQKNKGYYIYICESPLDEEMDEFEENRGVVN